MDLESRRNRDLFLIIFKPNAYLDILIGLSILESYLLISLIFNLFNQFKISNKNNI